MARQSQPLSGKTVAIWLAVFFLLSLGLRVGLNVGPSFDDEGDRYLYSGNDPYYHDRVVRHITETGQSVVFDDAINYPTGAYNPNPPIYDWTTAFVAGIFDMVGVSDPSGAALNSMVAVWGALTIFPVYIIATSLWGRHAGLWAAFLMGVSAPHIQRGVWGFADHDATTMFFITLAMMALVKGLQALDHREYVSDWRHGDARMAGIKASFAHNKTAMLWSTLAGVALSATALTWKGYPYVLAVMAVAVGFQLLWDHVKNKDSTALAAFYLWPMLLVTLIPLPYYAVYSVFLDTTIMAGLYVLIGVLLVAAILVPTRDLPSVVVFPALLLAGLAGLLVMLFAIPSVGQTVFTGLGYFEQTKLFTTIAEAQRSELGRVAASFGFFTFLLAFWGIGRSIKSAWKGDNAQMLMVAWALVAGFMAFAATRFIMNAAPVFAILAAGPIVSLIGMLKLDDVRRRFRQQHGQNQVGAAFKSLNMRSSLGIAFIAFFLVVPNLWLGVDAAVPREVEFENGWADNDRETTDRMGAFGIDFDVKDNGWLEVFYHLKGLDTDVPMEERPAFMAWWDYGHWATDLGEHPTVADPFQNHFQIAGRVLAAESEQEAMAWMTILIADDNHDRNGGYTAGVEAALRDVDEGLLAIGPEKNRDRQMAILTDAVDLSGDAIFGLYDAVTDGAGKEIRYLGVDVRMYPFSADNPGIFYAPAFLANKNPDAFLDYSYAATTGGLSLDVKQYAVDDNGNSYRLDPPVIEDRNGKPYSVAGNQAYPGKNVPVGAQGGTPVNFRLNPTGAFYDSFYANAFGHQLNGFIPGEGLEHWRVISVGGEGSVKLLEYFRGVPVSGRVVDDAGSPLADVDVTFIDGENATHHTVTTGDDGRYTVMAPFSVDGDLRLIAQRGGAEIASIGSLQFTREEARAGNPTSAPDLVVPRGSIQGNVFEDANGNTTFEAGEGLQGAIVTIGDVNVTAGADGSYRLDGVTPGSITVTANLDGFTQVTRTVTVPPGETATQDLPMRPEPSAVTFELRDQDGAVSQVQFEIVASDDNVQRRTTNSTGFATANLAPGDYTIRIDGFEVTQDGVTKTYNANQQLTVPRGGQPMDIVVSVTRTDS